MNRQPVTLHAHDSVNLTTGVVTRSDRSQPQTANDRLRNRNLIGLRANYLVALQLMIEQDPSIPSRCGGRYELCDLASRTGHCSCN